MGRGPCGTGQAAGRVCVCWEGRKVTLREDKDGKRCDSEMLRLVSGPPAPGLPRRRGGRRRVGGAIKATTRMTPGLARRAVRGSASDRASVPRACPRAPRPLGPERHHSGRRPGRHTGPASGTSPQPKLEDQGQRLLPPEENNLPRTRSPAASPARRRGVGGAPAGVSLPAVAPAGAGTVRTLAVPSQDAGDTRGCGQGTWGRGADALAVWSGDTGPRAGGKPWVNRRELLSKRGRGGHRHPRAPRGRRGPSRSGERAGEACSQLCLA